MFDAAMCKITCGSTEQTGMASKRINEVKPGIDSLLPIENIEADNIAAQKINDTDSKAELECWIARRVLEIGGIVRSTCGTLSKRIARSVAE
jgi:hypothetical protein